jgi:pyridoxine 5-phosphate synthase
MSGYFNCAGAGESNYPVILWGSAERSVSPPSAIIQPATGRLFLLRSTDICYKRLNLFPSSNFTLLPIIGGDVSRLGVNIDHVATLRQARGGTDPDTIAAAVLVELAGADGIVVHLREDRRHIQDRDLQLLRDIIHTKLDMEMAADDAMAKIALTVKPDMVTLVPERRQELTTEGGLDAAGHKDRIQQVVALLHNGGIPVSLFIEPDLAQVKAAHKISADFVELHTGRYANAKRAKEADAEVEAITQAARLAYKLGLGVNAGHGLNYQNVKRLTHVPEIVEYNIGHSIIARAVLVGLDQAVREMKALLG